MTQCIATLQLALYITFCIALRSDILLRMVFPFHLNEMGSDKFYALSSTDFVNIWSIWRTFGSFHILKGVIAPVAAEQKYDRGAGMTGCKAADYLRKASVCKGKKLGGLHPPPQFRHPCMHLKKIKEIFIVYVFTRTPKQNNEVKTMFCLKADLI